MGIKRAYEALTEPTPNDRQFLVVFMAERLMKRTKINKAPVRIEDVYWLIAVLIRWGFITSKEMPSLSRQSIGNLAEDVKDAWNILSAENI